VVKPIVVTALLLFPQLHCFWPTVYNRSCAFTSAWQRASIAATIAFANARYSSAQRICKHTLNVLIHRRIINVLDSKGNHSVTVTSNNTKLVHWPLMGALLHLVQRGGAWVGCGFAQYSLLAVQPVPNEAAHPSTASVPITVLLYDGTSLCGFNVAIKGLSSRRKSGVFTRCMFLCSFVCSSVCRLKRWSTRATFVLNVTTCIRHLYEWFKYLRSL